MIAWLQTDTGQAVSTLVSNGLSLLAIIIGVAVALVEQRRSNAEQEGEAARERQALERAERDRDARRNRLLRASAELIGKALIIMTTNLPGRGEMYAIWATDRGKPLELRALKTTIESLRSAALDDVDLILALNKASAVLDVTISPGGLGTSPPVDAVLRVLAEQADALRGVRRSLDVFGADPSW